MVIVDKVPFRPPDLNKKVAEQRNAMFQNQRMQQVRSGMNNQQPVMNRAGGVNQHYAGSRPGEQFPARSRQPYPPPTSTQSTPGLYLHGSFESVNQIRVVSLKLKIGTRMSPAKLHVNNTASINQREGIWK